MSRNYGWPIRLPRASTMMYASKDGSVHYTKDGTDVRPQAKTYILNLKLSTADGTMLHFPDDIEEATQITEGVGPVKLDNGKVATGDHVMPDGSTITINEKGYVTEVKEPAEDEKMAAFKKDAASIRAEIGRMAAAAGITLKVKPKPQPQAEAPKARAPFKAKQKPSGKRQPFHKPCK